MLVRGGQSQSGLEHVVDLAGDIFLVPFVPGQNNMQAPFTPLAQEVCDPGENGGVAQEGIGFVDQETDPGQGDRRDRVISVEITRGDATICYGEEKCHAPFDLGPNTFQDREHFFFLASD